MNVLSVFRSLQRKLTPTTPYTAAQIGRTMRSASRALLRPALTGTALLAPLVSLQSTALAQEAARQAVKPSDIVTPLQAVILGLVQGLTEFIPVSSSAHLNITHALMGHGRNLTYDVMLSIGTTIALAYYFRHDWARLMMDRTQAKLRNLVFLACVPAAVIGVFIHKYEKQPPLSEPWFNALMLVVAGLILLAADKGGTKRRLLGDVKLPDALVVGFAQAIALVPGVSRSGSTMTAGLLLGFKREDAARFSFLMSLPISVGAILYELAKAVKAHDNFGASPIAMVLGVLFSGISGFWAIGFLLNYLKTKDVTPFVVWRVLVAVATWMLLGRH